MAGPESNASPERQADLQRFELHAGVVAPAAVGEAAPLPAWLNPDMPTLQRVGTVLMLLWGTSWSIKGLSPPGAWLQSLWVQYPLVVAWSVLGSYLAAMAWQHLRLGAQLGKALGFIALGWMPLLVMLGVWLGAGWGLDKAGALTRELIRSPDVRQVQPATLKADLPVSNREFAASVMYQNLGVRVAWLNADGVVQVYAPTPKDKDSWRETQQMDQQADDLQQLLNRQQAQMRWAMGLMVGSFGLTQVLLALAQALTLRRRAALASPATSAPSAQG